MEQKPKKNALMKRFELSVDGSVAVLDYVEQGKDILIFTHTFVPPALRGKNIAARLTQYALDDARLQGKKVLPQCSYTVAYMAKNKEYADLQIQLPYSQKIGPVA